MVLDEQLQGLGLEDALSRWYRGAVRVVKQLRPGTVIKDDEIPALLRRVKQPTFLTINYPDFWRRAPASCSYCVICLDLAIEQAAEVAGLTRRAFRLPEFRTKAARMGKVALIRHRGIQYYGVHEKQVYLLQLPRA